VHWRQNHFSFEQ